MEELVSIITPSYNTADFIGDTIACVLAQTYQNWELLIVDDCSTDNTEGIVALFPDERIRFIKNETNSGAAVSRNRAISEAKGKWIAFLDSDDIWSEDKLAKQVAFMQDNGYHFSYTDYEEIDEKGGLLGKKITGPKKVTRRKMYRYCWLGCLTAMYDAEYVGLIQVSPKVKKRNDYAMWLLVSQKANCYLLKETLAYYRKRGGSLSNTGYVKLIKFHYRLFRYGMNFNPIHALWRTFVNLIFGVYKKTKYVKKYKVNKELSQTQN